MPMEGNSRRTRTKIANREEKMAKERVGAQVEDAELGVVEMRSVTEMEIGGGERSKTGWGRCERGCSKRYGREGGTIAVGGLGGPSSYTCKYLY